MPVSSTIAWIGTKCWSLDASGHDRAFCLVKRERSLGRQSGYEALRTTWRQAHTIATSSGRNASTWWPRSGCSHTHTSPSCNWTWTWTQPPRRRLGSICATRRFTAPFLIKQHYNCEATREFETPDKRLFRETFAEDNVEAWCDKCLFGLLQFCAFMQSLTCCLCIV